VPRYIGVWIDYSPPNAWVYYVQALLYLGVVTFVARHYPRFAIGATALMLAAGAIAYSVYHHTHDEPRYRQVFMDYEQVTPYHEQLMVPAFATLFTAVAIAAITASLRSRRAFAPLA
jgi:hypothetical protein